MDATATVPSGARGRGRIAGVATDRIEIGLVALLFVATTLVTLALQDRIVDTAGKGFDGVVY